MTSPGAELAAPIQLPGTTVRAQARWMARAGIVGLAVATVVALRLAAVLPDVPNRHALTGETARRAMLDVDAAEVLLGGDLLELVGHLVGSDTGTLLLLVAAPAHAAAGPAHALGVELGISLVFTALLFLVLGLAARCVGASTGEALVVLAISTPLLMGSRDLLGHAVSGMPEVPSAVFTLATVAAWLASRASRTYRPWAVALLGNALFHVTFQDGLMLALAVLLVEAGQAGWVRPPRALLSALFRGARSPVGLSMLVSALTVLLGGCWVVSTGGLNATVFGREVSLRHVREPVWLGALLLFLFVEFAFWHERVWLAAEVPRRARFLWKWLLTPMVVWILVPFSGRLQTFGGSLAWAGSGSASDWLLSLPRAAWEGWVPAETRWIVLALLCGSILAAFRSATTRLVLGSLGGLVLLEIAFLTLLQRGNPQPRLIVHLAPLVALSAAAWVPAVPHVVRTPLGAAAAALLLWMVLPTWRGPELVATLSRGFESTANGDACREVARALPITRGVLVNETAPARFETCELWVKFLARERGAQVLTREPWTRASRREVLVLEDGTTPVGPRDGLVALGASAQHGLVRGQRYRAEAP